MAEQSRHRIGACDAPTDSVTTRRAASHPPLAGGEAHACRDVITEIDWLSLRRGGGESRPSAGSSRRRAEDGANPHAGLKAAHQAAALWKQTGHRSACS